MKLLLKLQEIHIGQAGALGPGTVGPSLPRGAQGQHGSPPLLMAKHLAAAGPQPVIAGRYTILIFTYVFNFLLARKILMTCYFCFRRK